MYVAMFHRGSKTIEVPCSTAQDLICTETEYTSIPNPAFENGFIRVPDKPGLGFDDLNEEETAAYLKRFGGGVRAVGV